MDFPGTRRTEALSRIVQLRRRRRVADTSTEAPSEEHEQRIRALELRIDHLEALLEGLQDAVHRDSVRHDVRIEDLEKRTEPAEMSRALNQDARERGI